MTIASWNAGRFVARTTAQVATGMTKAVEMLDSAVKSTLDRVNRDGRHPSLPGEPPKTVSGFLRDNVSHEVEVGKEVRGFVGVRERVAYALRLELGFMGVDSLGRNVDQAPRPFLRPALLRNREKIVELIAKG